MGTKENFIKGVKLNDPPARGVKFIKTTPYITLENIEGFAGMLNYFALTVSQAKQLRDDLDAVLKDA